MDDAFSLMGDPAFRAIIRKKARRMIRDGSGPLDNLQDLEQELWLAFIASLGQFNPARCRYPLAFFRTVLNRAVARIERYRRAGKRSVMPGPLPASDKIPIPDIKERRTDQDLSDLTADIQTVLSLLADTDRELSELLKEESLAEAARRLGKPRSSLQHRVGRIRRVFGENNLDKYL